MPQTSTLGIPMQERYLALDVLRGLTIALMIVVNTPGDWSNVFSPFLHADWDGFTITDLVFPTFLFVVGNAMSFSMKKMEKMSQGVFLKKVFKRTALIFLIGWGLNAFPFFESSASGGIEMIDWTSVRLLGVLQRIALCYMIASLVLYYLGKSGSVVFSIVALLSYWAILYFFGNTEAPYSLEGNAALRFDLWLIGAKNLYMGEGIPFDPEGVLSTLPSVVNVIAGFLAGRFIQQIGNTKRTVKALLLAGLIAICGALIWDLAFPINKKIWTSSYVLLTVGLDLIVLGFLVLIIEVQKINKWTYPLEVFGRNPLILYILAWIVIGVLHTIPAGTTSLKAAIYHGLFTSWLGPKTASFLFAIAYMTLIWCIGYLMDKRKIYIKV